MHKKKRVYRRLAEYHPVVFLNEKDGDLYARCYWCLKDYKGALNAPPLFKLTYACHFTIGMSEQIYESLSGDLVTQKLEGKLNIKDPVISERLKGVLPTNVSELANDAGYQTEAQVAAAVAAADHLKRKIVDSVDDINPEADDATQYIYMVLKSSTKSGDKYDEYMVIDGAVERVGDWSVDLSGYVQQEEGKSLSSNDYTTEDKTKLTGVAEGATKAEASDTPGCVKINGEDVQVVEFATDAEVDAMLAEVFGVEDE